MLTQAKRVEYTAIAHSFVELADRTLGPDAVLNLVSFIDPDFGLDVGPDLDRLMQELEDAAIPQESFARAISSVEFRLSGLALEGEEFLTVGAAGLTLAIREFPAARRTGLDRVLSVRLLWT